MLTFSAGIGVPTKVGAGTTGFVSSQADGVNLGMAHLLTDGRALFVTFARRARADRLGVKASVLADDAFARRRDQQAANDGLCAGAAHVLDEVVGRHIRKFIK